MTQGLYAVPSLGYDHEWPDAINKVFAGANETMNDLVANRSSLSFQWASTYFREFVARYAARQHILFWELGQRPK